MAEALEAKCGVPMLGLRRLKKNRCRVKFGVNFHKPQGDADALAAADYVTVWLGSHSKKFGNGFNEYWHGMMLQHVRRLTATSTPRNAS